MSQKYLIDKSYLYKKNFIFNSPCNIVSRLHLWEIYKIMDYEKARMLFSEYFTIENRITDELQIKNAEIVKMLRKKFGNKYSIASSDAAIAIIYNYRIATIKENETYYKFLDIPYEIEPNI